MRDIVTIAKFTFIETARKKIFIISTIVMLIITTALGILPEIMDFFNNEKPDIDKEKNIVFYIDYTKIIDENIDKISTEFSGFTFKKINKDEINETKNKIKKNDNESLIILKENEKGIHFEYYINSDKNILNTEILKEEIRTINIAFLLKSAKVKDNTINKVLNNVEYKSIIISEKSSAFKLVIYGSNFVEILLLAIYFYGYSVAMSVSAERLQE